MTTEEMQWAARAFARTGAGKCWECGTDVPRGAGSLDDHRVSGQPDDYDYTDVDPLRLYCVLHVPSEDVRRRHAAAVNDLLDAAADALGVV